MMVNRRYIILLNGRHLVLKNVSLKRLALLFLGGNYRLKAFTLLEGLTALLVIMGSVQLYQGMTKVVTSHLTYLGNNREDDWILFCQQLQVELMGSRLERISDGKLYVRKGNKSLAYGQSQSDDFRKTNADGRGYQPMLFGVKSTAISQENHLVKIEVRFQNGLERTFLYGFKGKG